MIKAVAWIVLNFVSITVAQLLLPEIWWVFAPISVFMGFLLSIKQVKIRSFIVGFLSGFLSWTGGTLIYSLLYEGEILESTSQVFFMPVWLFVIVIGLVGGGLNGLSLYTGYIVFQQVDSLDLPE